MSDHIKIEVTHNLLVRELCKVTEWDVLGIYLGLDECEITEIERDHQSNARRRIAMLAKWMEKDVDASWEKVINALESMSQIRLANQLKEKLIQIYLLLLLTRSQQSLVLRKSWWWMQTRVDCSQNWRSWRKVSPAGNKCWVSHDRG